MNTVLLATPMAFGDIPSFAWKSQKSTCQVDIQEKKDPRKLESICLSAS